MSAELLALAETSATSEGSPLYHELTAHFPELRRAGSRAELESMPLYRRLEGRIWEVLDSIILDNTGPLPPVHDEFYRACAFNIERGVQFEGVVETLGNDPVISGSDIFILIELDIGMARTENRDVPRELARRLGLNYVFGPSFIELSKGLGPERLLEADNSYGLYGTAILSRFELSDPRLVRLQNGMDRMASLEPRIGAETAVLATAHTPHGPVRVGAIHLDVHCTRRHRHRQMEQVLAALADAHVPTLIGGDWNTSTLNAQSAWATVASAWWRPLLGYRRVTERLHTHPDEYSEAALFRAIESAGFDYRSWNARGVPTIRNDLSEERFRSCFEDGKPGWVLPLARWVSRSTGGRFPFKLDWLAGRGLECVHDAPARPPGLIPAVFRGTPVSDHDPIFADFRFPQRA